MRITISQQVLVTALGLALVFATHLVADTSRKITADVPPWEEELVMWPRYEGQPTPWRDDSRISPLSPEGYPDDFPVHFDNPDPTVEDEIMWVTAIDYFAPTDEYLGILLNSPNSLKSIKERDNAVFRYDSNAKQLRALSAEGSYRDRGLPPRVRDGTDRLPQGIRHYRRGNYGNDQAAIEQCISTLSSAIQHFGELASSQDRYLAYFLLGRCHAEAYRTDDAIESFRGALAHNGDDVETHMALLAEYSVKVHPAVDQPEEAYDASYEALFLEKLVYVRDHFSDDPGVAAITTTIFDESEATGLGELTAEEIERRRKFGLGAFRWKRH